MDIDSIQPYEEYPEDKNENATNKIQQQSSSQVLSKSPSPLSKHLSTSSKSSASTAAATCFGANKENVNKKRSTSSIGHDDLFVKRGKKSSNRSETMEEAVAAIKQLSNDSTVQMDVHDHFGAYVAARLRAMDEEQWRKIELEIIKILTNFSY